MECMNNDPMIKRQYTNWLDKREESEVKKLKFTKQSSLNGKRDLQLRLEQAKNLLKPEWLMDSQDSKTQRQLKELIDELGKINSSIEESERTPAVAPKKKIP